MSQFSPLSIGVALVAVFIVVMILSRVFGGPKVDYIQCPSCQKTMQMAPPLPLLQRRNR